MTLNYTVSIMIEKTDRPAKRVYHQCPSGSINLLGMIVLGDFIIQKKRSRYGDTGEGEWTKAAKPKTCGWCGTGLDWKKIEEAGWLSNT